MKRPKSLFFRHPRRPDLPVRRGVILVIALMIASLSACGGQAGATPAVNHKPGVTASSTQILKQTGSDAGLYIAHRGWAAASNESGLYKVDYQSGKVLWKYQFKLSHPVGDWGNYAPPEDLVAQQGLVFVTAGDAVKAGTVVYSVYAISAATGHLVWSHSFESSVELGLRGQLNMPVLSQGVYYITGIKEKNPDGALLYALDARTGKLLRTYHSVRGFAIQQNVLYTSDLDSGPIRAINLKNDQVLWEKRIGTNGQALLDQNIAGEDFMAPFLLKNRVYFRANNQDFPVVNHQIINQYKSSLYVFDAMSGQQLWHSPVVITSGPVFDFPLSDETLVSGVIGDGLFASHAANGNFLWSRKMGFAGNLVVSGKSIYATFDPNPVDSTWGYPPNPPSVSGIMSLDGATGSLIWQKLMTASSAGSDSIRGFLVHQGVLYIAQDAYIKGQETHRTTAMDTGGKVFWQINLGGSAANEVLVP